MTSTRQHQRLTCITPWATYIVEAHGHERRARRIGLLGFTTEMTLSDGTWRLRDGRAASQRHARILDQVHADLVEPR